jgi:hypothetical protein
MKEYERRYEWMKFLSRWKHTKNVGSCGRISKKYRMIFIKCNHDSSCTAAHNTCVCSLQPRRLRFTKIACTYEGGVKSFQMMRSDPYVMLSPPRNRLIYGKFQSLSLTYDQTSLHVIAPPFPLWIFRVHQACPKRTPLLYNLSSNHQGTYLFFRAHQNGACSKRPNNVSDIKILCVRESVCLHVCVIALFCLSISLSMSARLSVSLLSLFLPFSLF